MNCTEIARSNYFAVKDPEAFVSTFCLRWGVMPIAVDKGLVGFTAENGLPVVVIDDDGDDEDADFISELAEHLAPGTVAIVYTIWYEGLRYLGGNARAISPEHEDDLEVNLDSIYSLVKAQWGVNANRAEY